MIVYQMKWKDKPAVCVRSLNDVFDELAEKIPGPPFNPPAGETVTITTEEMTEVEFKAHPGYRISFDNPWIVAEYQD